MKIIYRLLRYTACFFLALIILVFSFTIRNAGAKKSEMFAGKYRYAGGREDYNYLALQDHIGPSGVPLGGIGVGCFDFAPDGRFTRIALNCTHEKGVIKDVQASFMALWQGKTSSTRSSARRMVRDTNKKYGMTGFLHSVYRGLFPSAGIEFKDSQHCRVSIFAYSGLVPHNLKDSTLPLAWFDVTVENPLNEPLDISVAFSWENIISRKIRDIKDKKTLDTIGRGVGQAYRSMGIVFPRKEVTAGLFRKDNWIGVRQAADTPLKPLKATFQNYVEEVAVLAEAGKGIEITVLPVFDVNKGSAAWLSFIKNGTFNRKDGRVKMIQILLPTGRCLVAFFTIFRPRTV